jgi:hypothetical protein
MPTQISGTRLSEIFMMHSYNFLPIISLLFHDPSKTIIFLPSKKEELIVQLKQQIKLSVLKAVIYYIHGTVLLTYKNALLFLSNLK